MDRIDWGRNAQEPGLQQRALHKYTPTQRALPAQAVQQLKQTLLGWVNRTEGEASQLLWPHRDRAIVLLMLSLGCDD